MHRIAPSVSRVALLYNPQTEPYARYYLDTFRAGAAALSVMAIEAPFHDAVEIESVMTNLGSHSGIRLRPRVNACSIGGIHRTWLNSQRNLCGREAEFPRAIPRRSSVSVCWRPLGRTNYAFAPLHKPGRQHKYCGSDGCPNDNFDDFARSKINAPQSQ
jgi:hypothetical protein